MGVQIEYSHVIDRPVEKVFRFMVDDHVQNHPRWDSDIELWLESDEQISVGTIIYRRNNRGGSPVEGTMEVVEMERNVSFATLIHDGPRKMFGRIEFDPVDNERTQVTMIIDAPDWDESVDVSLIKKRLEETALIRKNLIESEL